MQFTADGLRREQGNRALGIRRCRGGKRAHEDRGGDRRNGEVTAAGEDVVQAMSKPSAKSADRVVKRDRVLAAEHDAPGNMVIEILADARDVGDDGNAV